MNFSKVQAINRDAHKSFQTIHATRTKETNSSLIYDKANIIINELEHLIQQKDEKICKQNLLGATLKSKLGENYKIIAENSMKKHSQFRDNYKAVPKNTVRTSSTTCLANNIPFGQRYNQRITIPKYRTEMMSKKCARKRTVIEKSVHRLKGSSIQEEVFQ
ncbi:Hypothetical protein CINCED_3A022019 [Cinara cedri]|nr:Hypothetical protein CINCED_3A022019 [Cinara cedri]